MLNDQLGLVAESTYGTFVTPTRFLEFVSESVKLGRPRIEAAGLRPGRRVLKTGRWKAGRKEVGGSVEFEVASKGFGLVFLHMLGAVTITTPGGGTLTRDHTHTLGNLRGKSLTIQVGREDRSATVRPFSYLGCKIASWELGCSIDEILKLTLEILGQDESTAQSLAVASYASGDELFVFTEGALTVAAVSTPVREFALSGDNALAEDDYALGSALRREAVEPALREISGTLNADFTDLTAYNRFVNGTEATLELTFTGALIEGALNFQVKITANVRFDGETPEVGGPEENRLPLPYKVIAPAAGEPITLLYRTTDTVS
jgi:hypothetical protein